MKILVTGGAGYIGSHTCVELLDEGHEVIIVDNLSNSSKKSIEVVQDITGKQMAFYEGDLLDKELLSKIFSRHSIDAVIHFAGLKAVGESVAEPLLYYHNNISGTLSLLEIMQAHNVKTLVFSSSATVYGDPTEVPIDESFPTQATNPYGQTKLFIEQILTDLHIANPDWKISILRYFNPAGAHHSGRIGEDPNGIPNNLLPYISQVAIGQLNSLKVFGDDYPTPDGTGVRDYIHVVDLALGHIAALNHLDKPKLAIHNLGTGQGSSVLEAMKAFEKASGKQIPHEMAPRRSGDIAACYADPSKAEKDLGWRASRSLTTMCDDAWRWQSNNPAGYDDT
ncbi:MAG: UDP-glucose 4-epimerase GalE [Pseudomonadales bacterium]|nr:UDP-glucose 4-epimerase GalE [Pseudomonadales bacterium]